MYRFLKTYQKRGIVILVQSQKSCANLYDFVGKVLQTKSVHTAGTDTNEILQTYTYDHAGRLMEVKQELDNDPTTEIILLSQNYNELGELIEKNLHSEDDGASFAQSVDYRYNIRGWLTSINDNTLSDGENDYFGMELLYNNQDISLGNSSLFNGNISAVKWTSGVNGSEQQAYTYSYDPMNRITNATSKKLDISWLSGNTNMSVGGYDLNGNILSLTRNGANGVMDNMTYAYGTKGNQLQSVTDAGDITQGFKDGNTTGNDYDYDGNGNMTEDKNKDITAIEYNHLNLPGKVTKGTGEYIKYVYDATGIKLAQEVYNASDELQKRTDYAGQFIYETIETGQAELQFIQTAEGRIIPGLVPGSPVEYQYHLKDHLGNTRVSFTTKDEVDTYLATMETEYRTYETATFTNVEETDKQDQLFNNTPPDANVAIPAYSAMLNSINQIMGPAKSISVAPGDVINVEVWAKYATASYNGNGDKVLANTMLAAIATAFTPVGVTAEVAQQILDQFTVAGAGALSPAANTDAPAAYLNYLLFDTNYLLIQSGFEGISTAAEGSFEKLETIPPVSITEAGYLYIYVSNEDAANVNVYFDDLKITHTKSKIVQMDSYYPFGLTFNSFKREDNLTNKFKYNGFEEQSELDWNVYDYQARYYDPALGRFLNVDPAADLMRRHSPYNYAFDNPIRFTDPDGMIPNPVNGYIKRGVKYVANRIKTGIMNAAKATVKGIKEGAANIAKNTRLVLKGEVAISEEIGIQVEIKGGGGGGASLKTSEISASSELSVGLDGAKVESTNSSNTNKTLEIRGQVAGNGAGYSTTFNDDGTTSTESVLTTETGVPGLQTETSIEHGDEGTVVSSGVAAGAKSTTFIPTTKGATVHLSVDFSLKFVYDNKQDQE